MSSEPISKCWSDPQCQEVVVKMPGTCDPFDGMASTTSTEVQKSSVQTKIESEEGEVEVEKSKDEQQDNGEGDETLSRRDYSQGRSVPGNILQHDATTMRVQKLPVKLNGILADQSIQHIVSWMPHGRAWKVHNTYLFVEQVIPKYFGSTNYNSFIRLINAWGFRRVTRGTDRNAYYHEKFLRGIPHLFAEMHRLTPNEKKPPLRPDDEPDFYNMDVPNPWCSEPSTASLSSDNLSSHSPRPQTIVNSRGMSLLRQHHALLPGQIGRTNSMTEKANPLGRATTHSSGRFPFPLGFGRISDTYGIADPLLSARTIDYTDPFFGINVAARRQIGQGRREYTFPLPQLGPFSSNSIDMQIVELAAKRRWMESQIDHIREQENRLDLALASVVTLSAHRHSAPFDLTGLVESSRTASNTPSSMAQRIRQANIIAAQAQRALQPPGRHNLPS